VKSSSVAHRFVVLHRGRPLNYGGRHDPLGRVLCRGGVFFFRSRSAALLAIKRTVDAQKRICAAFPKWKYAAPDLAVETHYSIAPQFSPAPAEGSAGK
jgi:hypothetical protein